MIHEEEFQAWELLQFAQTQLRFLPTGQVIGLDWGAIHLIGQARRYDMESVSLLIQEAESALLKLFRREKSDQNYDNQNGNFSSQIDG